MTVHVSRLQTVAVGLALAAGIAFSARPAHAQQVASSPPAIIVSGEGKVRRVADRAVVTIGAQARASKPSEAKRIADDAMRSILTALKDCGIPDSAIRTTSYAIRPDYGEGRVKGYNGENQIVVLVDTAGVWKVLDAAGSSGASTTHLRFEISDRQAAEDEALKLAAESALRRAKILAGGIGVELGPILRLGESGVDRGEYGRTTASAGADSSGQGAIQIRFVTISSGEVEIVAQVTLVVSVR